jgi:uridine monophosphate synthetase
MAESMAENTTLPFLKQLDARAQTANSLLCVGLDPHAALLPEFTPAAVRDFCFRLIEATADLACAFKPNAAFFEALGDEGYGVLRQVIARVPPGIPVILDAKRGDIASTAETYAYSAFDVLGATAITLSPYLGRDSLEPFLNRPGKGGFVLCKTSNPGADELQNLPVGSGEPLYQAVARHSRAWNASDNLGLVVGATDVEALAQVRAIAPETWFLVPGVGVQGGDLEATLRAGLRADGMGVLINVSRSIAQAADPRAEAKRLRETINAVRAEMRQTPVAADYAIRRLARALADAGCVQFGSFTLKSGSVSPIYLDLRRLVSYPASLRVVAEALARLLDQLKFDHMAGIPYAALPIVTATALISGRSMIYPRREVKDYGTKAAIEGVYKPGDTAVLIDDLATTGGSKFEVIDRLKAAGLIVKDVVVVIDREQGAAAAIREVGYGFHAITTLRQLLDVWEAQGILTVEQRRKVDEYLAQ